MAGYAVAKEMPHPSGSKVLLAYSTEEEREILASFARYRAEQDEAHRAAIEGREIRPLSTETERRGPGRPRNPENV